MNTNILTWTSDRIERLKELVATGLAFSGIAAELGVTRNAAIGKAQRLKLDGQKRRMPLTTAERNERRKLWRAHKRGGAVIKNGHMEIPIWKPAKPQLAPKPIETPPLNIGFMKLKSHHCRWITGKGEDGLATFCGHDIDKRSFCGQHYWVTRQAGTRQV